MDLTWINVVDTAVKIGLGAIIIAVSGYLVLVKTQSNENDNKIEERFYKLQDEKKYRYIEFLAQSQELIQCNLYTALNPSSVEHQRYLRIFNEVQIISSDEGRVAAFYLMNAVNDFVFLRKNEQEIKLIDNMEKLAREKVSIFQKYAQLEATKIYNKKDLAT